MKRFKFKKRIYIKSNRIILLIVIIIVLNTYFFYLIFLNKLSESLIETARREIKEITFNIVTKNLTKEKLSSIAAEELIVIKKNKQDEITDVDFKLDLAYAAMIDIKSNVEEEVKNLKYGNVPSTAISIGDNLIIKIPYYTYTKNGLLMNLGPKIHVKINLLENVIGDVFSKISSYGINTVLINLYLKLYITESFLYPVYDEKINLEFEVLIASRVIQGKIPSFYNGVLENSSPIINVK
ncbi:MAG: sporulation protein YunB [Bacilli bacterium]|nr:sporulation protein YunB [Bacilli bacterium]